MSGPIIIRDVEQSTPAWSALRAGIPTASNFDRIVTPGKCEASKQQGTYMLELLAEWLSGRPAESYTNAWMERGLEVEQEARDYYTFATDTMPEQVGFIYSDERRLIGCSPDGLIGDDGMLEIKCPKPSTHLGYLLAGQMPTDYRSQVYGSLLVSGRAWCDFVSYCPGLPGFVVRVRRDMGILLAMERVIERFVAELLAKRKELLKLGYSQQLWSDTTAPTPAI